MSIHELIVFFLVLAVVAILLIAPTNANSGKMLPLRKSFGDLLHRVDKVLDKSNTDRMMLAHF